MNGGTLLTRWACRAAAVLILALATLVAAAQVRGETAAGTPAGGALSSSPLNALKGLFGGSKSEPELLEPDKAFQLAVTARDSSTLAATLTPAPEYYLYRDRISFTVLQPATLKVERVTFPKGEPKDDPNFGSVEVFKKPFEVVLALKGTGAGAADTLQLKASYQGCNEPLGVCYPPIEKTVTVSLAGAGTSSPAASPLQTDLQAVQDFDDRQIRDVFFKGSTWALVAAFFGFGLLLAFTPCMLPMIPILSGIIVGSGQHASRRQMLLLSCAYVLGMALTYAAAGVAAGLAGTLLSTYLQNPWVLGGFAAVFVLLALSMFGLYELQLPASLQTRLAAAGSRLPGGRLLGVFGMGVLSAVIVGPCVAAPLAGALLYIGQTRDVALGGTALFTMAIGMGVPLLVLAATAGALLPKAGPWMVSVNRVFGVLMLAVAAYMLSRVFPSPCSNSSGRRF